MEKVYTRDIHNGNHGTDVIVYQVKHLLCKFRLYLFQMASLNTTKKFQSDVQCKRVRYDTDDTTIEIQLADENMMCKCIFLMIDTMFLQLQCKKPTPDQIAKFAPIQMIIIDEISMIDQHFFAAISSNLQTLKQCTLPFGGISLAVSGDFCQIPPIAGISVFVDPGTKPRETGKRGPSLEGFNLWRLINVSITLRESMRFHADPVYGNLMASLRLGRLTNDQLNLLNSRIVEPSNTLQSGKHLPYLAISHALRVCLNRISLFAHARNLNRMVHTFDAIHIRSKRCAPLTPAQLRAIQLLPEQQTQFMPTTLQLFVGMHVMVTHNVDILSDIANGTLATVAQLEFDDDDTTTEIQFADGSTTL